MSNDIKGLVLVLSFVLASAPAAVYGQGRDGIDRETRGEKASSGDRADKGGRERPDTGGGREPAVVETGLAVGAGIKELIKDTGEKVKESKSEWERFERETENPAPTPEPSPEATPDREDRPDRR